MCVSLEEWGARIFKPHNKKVLRDAKMECEITNQQFNRANNVIAEVSFTTTDLSSSKYSMTIMMKDKNVKMRRWLTTFHQINTKIRKRRGYITISVVAFNSY